MLTSLRLCLFLLLLACLARSAHATAAPGADGAVLTGDVLIDARGQWGPDEALARLRAGQGLPYSPTAVQPTGGATAVWFWLDVPPPALREPAVLLISYPGLNLLKVFEPEAGSTGWREQVAGDAVPVARWAIPHLYPAIPLALDGASGRRLLVRVQHSHPATFPWRIEPRAAFESERQRLVLAMGMYLGLVSLVVVLSIVNAITLREPIHAIYAVYVILLALTQSTLTGVAGLFFWPDDARWNDLSAAMLPAFSVAGAAWFVRAVIAPVPRRWLGWLLWACVAAGLILATLFAVVGRGTAFRVVNYYFLLVIPVCLGALVWYARARSVHGWWLVAGLSALFVGALFTILRHLGLMPLNVLSQHGAQIGVAIEIPLLLLGLYLRSRDRRDALVRRAALQTRDPVTGLANDRVTRERVDHLVQRLSMQPGRACVMRVRVGNLKDVLAQHGIQVMASATLHAASCLSLITREGDTVGRLKHGDFVLILERSLTEGQALQEAARVVARGLAYSPSLPAGVTIRFYVALSLCAGESGDAQTLLGEMDLLLDNIAEEPQRVIRIAPPVSAPASQAGNLARG